MAAASAPAAKDLVDGAGFGEMEALDVVDPDLLEHLEHLGTPMEGIEHLDPCHATVVAMSALRSKMPTPDSNPALNALKALRDKRLAHPEHIEAEAIPKTAWEPAEKLIETAQSMMAVLGCITSTIYSDNDGEYFMSTDAQRASMATRRLLVKLGIAKPSWPGEAA